MEGVREVTGSLSVFLPGDQDFDSPNIVDEKAKAIKDMIKIACKKKPYNYLDKPGNLVVDAVSQVAKALEEQQNGVKVYTELAYRTCVKGHCGGVRGLIRKIRGTCSPFHWSPSITGPRLCKPMSAEEHPQSSENFLDHATAEGALPRCLKEHIDEFEHAKNYEPQT